MPRDVLLVSETQPFADNIPQQPAFSTAGNIHKPQYRAFWTDVVQPDKWVLEVLNEGYKLPFKSQDPPSIYMEKNNKSALDNLPFVREEVSKYVDRRVVLPVQKCPTCVSSLMVSLRHITEDEVKKRLCLDLSRWINLALLKEAVTLPSLGKALKSLLLGDYMATYNLSSAYHHVRIHEEHWQFLGFSVPDENGKDCYCVFTCMSFGLALATHCLAWLTKPICALLAK